eukprot:scaffold35845_cov40-Tisochrysis_lutea.AAC.2
MTTTGGHTPGTKTRRNTSAHNKSAGAAHIQCKWKSGIGEEQRARRDEILRNSSCIAWPPANSKQPLVA